MFEDTGALKKVTYDWSNTYDCHNIPTATRSKFNHLSTSLHFKGAAFQGHPVFVCDLPSKVTTSEVNGGSQISLTTM